MKLGTFKGGVHPEDGKGLSMNTPIKLIMPKGELVFPLNQHIGSPSKPIVKIKDRVLVGQVIAEGTGFISSNIISSVSGEVKAIEERLTVSGNKVISIIVENDNEYIEVEDLGHKRNYMDLTREEIRKIVKESGIVGLGGAGFPTHVKLSPKDDEKIEYVIVNGAECEPYLTSDYRIMIVMPEKLVLGLKVILRLFPKAKGIIAIEDNKHEAIAKLIELTKNEEDIEVKVLKTKYPQGSERKLIYATTGKKINSSMLPSDVGCIVDNVDTVVSIAMAVCFSTPLMRRIVTVSGDAINNPRNFEVRIGTSYSQLIDEAEGFKISPKKIISGGPMMGTPIYNLDIPIVKTSSAILAFSYDDTEEGESSCIRCGRCIEVCPSNLVPIKLMEQSEKFNDESFVALQGMECYECGSCSYICPAKRRITQSVKQTRKSVIDNRNKK